MMSSFPPLTAIERPHCPRCHPRRMLVRIFPVPDHEESRTFECAKCSFTEIVGAGPPEIGFCRLGRRRTATAEVKQPILGKAGTETPASATR